MQEATEQVQVEIDQMYLEHQSQQLREGRIERRKYFHQQVMKIKNRRFENQNY
jgi:hypothetical protein